MPDNIFVESNIFVENKEYTFVEATNLFARAFALVRDENAEEGYSIADILNLIRCVNERVPGEFEIYETDSEHCRVVYKPEKAVIEKFKERWKGFTE